MKGDLVACANPSCGIQFVKATHNQKYHDEACCREATNNKLKEKYHERKARRAGRIRICKNLGCGTVLSKYNPGKICGGCESKTEEEKKLNILRMIG